MNIFDIYPDILQAPVEIRLSRAKAEDTPVNQLELLSKDSFWFVRDYVALNRSTPDHCLQNLLNDPVYRVRCDAERSLEKRQEISKQPSLQSRIQSAEKKKEERMISSDRSEEHEFVH